MSRYPAVPLSKLPADVKPWAEELHNFVEELAVTKDGPIFQYAQADGALIGPYPIVIASKEIGKVLKDMQNTLKNRTDPPADVRVVAILAVVAKFQAKFAKYSFTETGKKVAGMSEEQLEALRNGRKPAGLSEAASTTWDVVNYLANEKGPMPDHLYDTAVKVLGKEGVLVAVHYAGFYSHICMLENFADAPYPDGVDGL
ncbi:hypothetical protein AC578_10083 [Pseudocercospora eumusae]|uniref:Carboxymuconolactone decarboxylase-like domain-containing protein n=1 Tax=Pseudocercospora eumusae TaxID=321146 RepID=A0A139GWX9_9PEZI|nr:hypothetical protein AC578_10083 [Pseudocercospora eumusae]